MAGKNEGRPKTAGRQTETDDTFTNEEGEEGPKLALDEFFRKYVDKWFNQGKVDSGLYYRCCGEINKLKGDVKESKNKKLKQIKQTKEKLDAVRTVEQQPDFDKSKQKTSREKLPRQGVHKGSKEKSSPVPEHYGKITEQYQQALNRIQDLEHDIAKLTMESGLRSRTVEELQGELKRSYARINDIQTRYSKLASDTLKNSNPNIADLSDPYRPTEITKHFSELYDNEWSDAYEILTSTLRCSDKDSLQILFDTVERSFEFMQEQREKQVQLIRQALLCPVAFALKKEDTKMEDVNKYITKENMEIQIKEIRKTHAPTTAEILARAYRDIELGRLLAPHGNITNPLPQALMKYAYRCAQLSWHMVVADPPIYMSKSVAGNIFDLERYRPYTKSIKGQEKVVVETDVWPALYLHVEGPLLNKGVAQPGHAH